MYEVTRKNTIQLYEKLLLLEDEIIKTKEIQKWQIEQLSGDF